MRRLLGLFLVLCTVPAAAGIQVGVDNPEGPVPVTLYFHLLEGQNDVPINTQVPYPEFQSRSRVGVFTNSLCFGEAHDVNPLLDKEYHTTFAYSSPSYVEYEFLTDGKPRLHPYRLLGYEVAIDPLGAAELYWYLETSSGVDVGADQPPVVVPNVVVEATMRDGDAISVGDEAYRDGNILMHGRSNPALLARDATSGATWDTVDGKDVYGIRVPLDVLLSTIPETGYNVEVNVYTENPYCNSGSEGDYVMPNTVVDHIDPDHLPRIQMWIHDPLRIEYVHPQFVGDQLVIHTAAQSAWGNYDIDETSAYNGNQTGGVVARILDAAGDPIDADIELATFIQRYREHEHQDEPVQITYVWNHTAEGAPSGLYAFQFAVRNDQHTAWANATAAFEIGRGTTYPAARSEGTYDVEPRSVEMPGLGLVAALLSVALVAVLWQRSSPKL